MIVIKYSIQPLSTLNLISVPLNHGMFTFCHAYSVTVVFHQHSVLSSDQSLLSISSLALTDTLVGLGGNFLTPSIKSFSMPNIRSLLQTLLVNRAETLAPGTAASF